MYWNSVFNNTQLISLYSSHMMQFMREGMDYYLILLIKMMKLRLIEVTEFIKVDLFVIAGAKECLHLLGPCRGFFKKHATSYCLEIWTIIKKRLSFLNASQEFKKWSTDFKKNCSSGSFMIPLIFSRNFFLIYINSIWMKNF